MRPEDKDIAAGLQYTYEKLFFRILDQMFGLRPTNNLCLGGGSAYNGTANGKIHKKTQYKNLWIPPAPSDAGSAIGAALFYYYTESETDKRIENKSPFLGPFFSNDDVENVLKEYEDDIFYVKKTNTKLIDHIAGEITRGNVVGWFEGKLEFGARALGNRSILANPRDPQMKQRLNRVVKKRENFRPFAPIVKEEDMTNYFDYKFSVPYMNQVVHVKEEHQKDLPAITHVDGSARIQTLNNKQHNRMYSLLTKLKEVNKYPIVLNTSFNLKDQTMVRDPKTAIDTFLDCEMDTLVIHNYVIKKNIK
jgi:carbamoyltransferase